MRKKSKPSRTHRADPRALVVEAVANPFRFFTFEEAAGICGLGENSMTALAAAGAPIVGRKINPHLLLKWLETNAGKVGKTRRTAI